MVVMLEITGETLQQLTEAAKRQGLVDAADAINVAIAHYLAISRLDKR